NLFTAMGNPDWGPPVLMKIDRPVKGECLPTFARHNGRLYRFDVFGGSKLKPDVMREDYGMLIGVPVEAAEYYKQTWLTSLEAYIYAQRAFMPEKPDAPNHGLKGPLNMALIPDAQARQLVRTMGAYGNFQTQDGCGFIKASKAQLGGLISAHANRPA